MSVVRFNGLLSHSFQKYKLFKYLKFVAYIFRLVFIFTITHAPVCVLSLPVANSR